MGGVSGAHATGGLFGDLDFGFGNSGKTRSWLLAGNGGGGGIGVSRDELALPAAFAGGSRFELKSGNVAS